MILDTVSRSLEIVLGEAKVTSDCDIIACWGVSSPSAFTPTMAHTVSNGTTAVPVVPAPAGTTQAQVSEVRLFNNDTVAHQVTLRLADGTTRRIILSLSVQPGGHFVYTPGSGAAFLQKFWRSS